VARFYVLRGRRALWNLLIVAVVILALVYVFKSDDDDLRDNDLVEDVEQSAELVKVAPVTVRAVPTKFAEYKLERERMRSRQLELLQNVAYDSHSNQARREEVQKELQGLIDKISRETEIENLLKAKGYLDGLVILDKDNLTVVVPVILTREEAARIGELVHRMTGVRLERITIVDEAVAA